MSYRMYFGWLVNVGTWSSQISNCQDFIIGYLCKPVSRRTTDLEPRPEVWPYFSPDGCLRSGWAVQWSAVVFVCLYNSAL